MMTTNMTMTGRATFAVGLLLICVGCDNTAEAGVPTEPPRQTTASITPQPVPAPVPQPVPTTPLSPALKFSFTTDMTRVGGAQEGDALVCKKTNCKSGLVAFGPYTTAVPGGDRVATFRLSGVGVAGVERVAEVDVFDALSNQRLAVRTIAAGDLPDPKQQNIELSFKAPEKSKLEFRVGWLGAGELRLYGVEVR